MEAISYGQIVAACSAGGASTLSSTTELVPAAGLHASVAPAKFVRGTDGSYAYEPRFIDGQRVETVVIDSKQSILNRIEAELSKAIVEGDPLVSRLPRIEVTYESDGHVRSFTDLELPHRAFDAHIRAGMVGDLPVTANATYRAARNSTPADARALLELSPVSLVFGSWDSTRKSNQGRWRSVLVGEIIGVVDDEAPRELVKKGGARVDPVAMQVNLSGSALQHLADGQKDEISTKLYEKVSKQAKKIKAGETDSASALGFGGIPPVLNQLAGVACLRIIRSHVLSFAALRQMRFGAGTEGDAACRALLAALALNGLARSDSELFVRANCDLREAGPNSVVLDQRGGEVLELTPLTIEQADALLAEAIEAVSTKAGVTWDGQVFEVTGNPEILAGALDDVDGDE